MTDKMQLLFLGTGAADTMHDTFSDNFQNADERRCTCTLVNGHILLDCGPHAADALRIAQIPFGAVTDVIFTHLHDDHFDLDVLREIAAGDARTLHVWYLAGEAIHQLPNCQYHPVQVFCPYNGGGFTLTPLSANHSVHAIHLLVQANGKTLYYALDGAWMTYDTRIYLQNQNADVAVIDCTTGDTMDFRFAEHNSIPMLRLMAASFRTQHVLDEEGSMIVSHIARTLHLPHEQTAALLEKDGFTAAYDGMYVEI